MENIYSITVLLSILSFTLATVLSPGPNNILLMTSGLNFGYKKTLPSMLGVILGFTIMVILVGLGIGLLFTAYPFMYKILNVLGFSYLLWMAWKIASSTASIDDNDEKDNKPFTFIQLVVFQWLNPKAWVMAITSTSTFTSGGENIFSEVLIIAFIYFLSGIISTNTWTIGGVFLKKIIKNDKSLKIFNITMALFIVLSIIPVML